jgi:hypothetical protein
MKAETALGLSLRDAEGRVGRWFGQRAGFDRCFESEVVVGGHRGAVEWGETTHHITTTLVAITDVTLF